MTLSEKIRAPAEKWATDPLNEGKECMGAARRLLLQGLKAEQPGKCDTFLQAQLTRIICKNRGVIKPDRTPNNFKRKAIGDPTSRSKEMVDESNAKWNPINNPINGPINNRKKQIARRKEAIDLLTKKGHADLILSMEEVKQKVHGILHEKRSEWGQKSIMDLVKSNKSFSFYFGETKRLLTEEDLQFLGRRGANTKVRTKDGAIQLNRPVILRADSRDAAQKTPALHAPGGPKGAGLRQHPAVHICTLRERVRGGGRAAARAEPPPSGPEAVARDRQKDAGHSPEDDVAYKV